RAPVDAERAKPIAGVMQIRRDDDAARHGGERKSIVAFGNDFAHAGLGVLRIDRDDAPHRRPFRRPEEQTAVGFLYELVGGIKALENGSWFSGLAPRPSLLGPRPLNL